MRIGKYSVDDEIGRGGMSVVHAVRHESLRSCHAVKVFDVPECANRDGPASKFLAEAILVGEIAAKLGVSTGLIRQVKHRVGEMIAAHLKLILSQNGEKSV